jgi:hypothetical protein
MGMVAGALLLLAGLVPAQRREAPPVRVKRTAVATHTATKGAPSVLLARSGGGAWQRVKSGDDVFSTDTLVSLPGYASEVVSKKGKVGLLLRGLVREFAPTEQMTLLMEPAVVLHESRDFDLDLTLLRGRIYLSNRTKEEAVKVRVRFVKETWDLTLQKGTEVGIDLFKVYTRDIKHRAGEEPRADLYLCVVSGEVEAKVDALSTHNLEAPPGTALIAWDSFTKVHDPVRLPKLPAVWDKAPPKTAQAKAFSARLATLEKRFDGKKSVEAVLAEAMASGDNALCFLALYCFAASDDVKRLLDALGDDRPERAVDRDTAIYALRRWLSQGPGQVRRLYDAKKKTGALIEAKYRPAEAQTIADLLFDFREEERRDPDTFTALANALEHRKVAIAHLAHWHLQRLTYPMKLPAFNAAGPIKGRKPLADYVRKLVDEGKLPVPPKAS